MVLRKLLAGVLVGVAVWIVATLMGVGGDAAGTRPVLVAAQDFPAGHRLAAGDTKTVAFDPAVVPASAQEVSESDLDEGRVLTAPIGAGEMVTRTRLRSPDTFDTLPADRRAIRVPLDDAGAAALLRAGTRVDVHAGFDGKVLVADVPVLQVDGLGDESGTSGPGVVLDVPTAHASTVLAAMSASGEASGGVALAVRGE